MRIAVGNVSSKVLMCTPEEEAWLHTSLCVSVPNHQFMRAYKQGTWDGTKRFYSEFSKTFPTGFLPFIVENAASKGWQVETVDQRQVPALPDPSNLAQRYPTLRGYQHEGLHSVLTMTLRSGNQVLPWQRGILKYPTGSGKTKIASALISFLGQKTLYIVERKELLHQTYEAFIKDGWDERTLGLLGDGHASTDATVTFGMVQTIRAIFDAEKRYSAKIARMRKLWDVYMKTTAGAWGELPPQEPSSEKIVQAEIAALRQKRSDIETFLQNIGCLFYDECQHLAEGVYHRIASKCPAPFRFGTSATPLKRGDLGDVYLIADTGEIIAEGDREALQLQGYLAKPKIYMFKVFSPDLAGLNIRYPQVYRLGISENDERNVMIVQAASMLVRKRGCTVLVLVNYKRHGQILQSLLTAANLRTRFVHGVHTMTTRKKALHDLGKRFDVLVSTQIFGEGIDLPALDGLIRAGGWGSSIQSTQNVGRALRPKQGRNEVYIVDFIDQTHKDLLRQSHERLATYKAEGFEIQFPKHV